MPFRSSSRPGKHTEPLDENALYDYAAKSLGRRMRTVVELTRLLRGKVEPGETGKTKIDAVLSRLHEYRFLDDPSFASTYTRLRQENQHLGRRRVQQDLLHKGIDKELAAETLDRAYGEISEEELARQYIKRKRMQKPADEKQSARMVRQLTRAGYSPAIIFRILRSWELPEAVLEQLNEDDEPEVET